MPRVAQRARASKRSRGCGISSAVRTRSTGRKAAGSLAGLALACTAAGAAAETFNAERYADLLARHTREVDDTAGVRVDYAGLARAQGWRRVVSNLSRADPAALGGRDERLAYWINAYNILAIDVVVGSYPVDSIKDVGSFLRPVWKREAGTIGGRAVTLDEIEHRILRPMGEPRIHAAIVCASVSCPPLRREPFRAAGLDAQLDEVTRRWLADPRKGAHIDPETRSVALSRIFDWFEEDFAGVGGVLAFVARHVGADDRRWLEENGDRASLRYLDYDWRLNDLARAPR